MSKGKCKKYFLLALVQVFPGAVKSTWETMAQAMEEDVLQLSVSAAALFSPWKVIKCVFYIMSMIGTLETI